MIVSTAYFSPHNILHLKWFVPYQLLLPRSCVWPVHLCADSPPNTWHCHQGHFPYTASLGYFLTQKSPCISLLMHSTISQLPCSNWPAWVFLGRGTVLPGFCKRARLPRQGQRRWEKSHFCLRMWRVCPCLPGCLHTPCLHCFIVNVMRFMRLCEKWTFQDDREKGKGKKREKNGLEGMIIPCHPY